MRIAQPDPYKQIEERREIYICENANLNHFPILKRTGKINNVNEFTFFTVMLSRKVPIALKMMIFYHVVLMSLVSNNKVTDKTSLKSSLQPGLPDCMNKLVKLLSMLFVFLCICSLLPLSF